MKRAALLAAAALAALLVEGADAQEVLGWHPSVVLSAAYSPDGKPSQTACTLRAFKQVHFQKRGAWFF